jgi:endonuclease YncB( thermonuclease family)
MPRLKPFTALLILALLAQLSIATPNEASGVVTRVIDGDTFDVQDFGIVRLADVDCPEILRPAEKEAAAFANKWLRTCLAHLNQHR